MADYGPLFWIPIALWVFCVGVDQRSWGALQIHQPIVSGTVTGILAGIPWVGVLVGSALQALWIRPLPVGGNIPPASGLAACTGVLWIYIVSPWVVEPNGGELPTAWFLLAALALASAWIGVRMEVWIRRLNAMLESRGMKRIESWNVPMAWRTTAGIALAGLSAWVTVGVCLLLGLGLWRIILGSHPELVGYEVPPVRKVFAFAWILLGIGLGGESARLGRERWQGLLWVALGVVVGTLLGRMSP
jgi:mannose/fructose/N-acetylgalactosamine-specific phosphotransferase system component IIC